MTHRLRKYNTRIFMVPQKTTNDPNNQSYRVVTLELKLSCAAIVMMTASAGIKRDGRTNGIEDPETKWQRHTHLIFDKGSKNVLYERVSL